MFQSTRPRGARRACPTPYQHHQSFQSTRPRGARQCLKMFWFMLARFQSTRPRGARRWIWLLQHSYGSGFNPRAHAGRDGSVIGGWCGFRSFNPRAHAGRDLSCGYGYVRTAAFQSTRPRGARPRSLTVPCTLRRFNPRAHAGRDFLNADGGGG